VDVVEAAAAPASDVLPVGVRRRLTRRDTWLPLVLTGELLAGMLLGMAWHVATAVPAARPPAVGDLTTGDRAVSGSAGGAATPVPPPAAAPTAQPPLRTGPRNPFAMQLG
jgi:hypothetical protein